MSLFENNYHEQLAIYLLFGRWWRQAAAAFVSCLQDFVQTRTRRAPVHDTWHVEHDASFI